MKVILLEPLENLGDVGQVVDVKPGYARNYLLPRGLAVLATESNLKALECPDPRPGQAPGGAEGRGGAA